MFRTAAVIGVAILVAMSVGNIVLGVAGGIIGLLLSLAWLVLKILIIGGIAYFVIAAISPDTARRIRESIGGGTGEGGGTGSM